MVQHMKELGAKGRNPAGSLPAALSTRFRSVSSRETSPPRSTRSNLSQEKTNELAAVVRNTILSRLRVKRYLNAGRWTTPGACSTRSREFFQCPRRWVGCGALRIKRHEG